MKWTDKLPDDWDDVDDEPPVVHGTEFNRIRPEAGVVWRDGPAWIHILDESVLVDVGEACR